MKLNVQKLLYHYPHRTKPVLRDVSFKIDSGNYVCIAGPNGSGKSTLLRILCSLIDPEGLTGEVLWDDQNIFEMERREIAKKIAFVPESIFPEISISVFEFILQGRYSYSNFWSKPSLDDEKISYAAIKSIGIESISEKSITEISSGQLQLTALARALAQKPSALLLDESTANLDLEYQVRIFDVLSKLHFQGMTILMTSHDLNVVAEYCPQIIWIKSGEVLGQGKTESMLTDEWISKVYGENGKTKVGLNPYTHKPKLFLNKF